MMFFSQNFNLAITTVIPFSPFVKAEGPGTCHPYPGAVAPDCFQLIGDNLNNDTEIACTADGRAKLTLRNCSIVVKCAPGQKTAVPDLAVRRALTTIGKCALSDYGSISGDYVADDGSKTCYLYPTAVLFRSRQLDHIPTVGYSTPFLSIFSAFKFLLSGRDIVEEGYHKYPGRVWKLPMIEEWLVVANGRQRVEDIRKASESQLSGIRSNPVFYQWDYTLGPAVSDNPYHINVVRGPLTRNLANQFSDLHDEMVLALDDMIPCKDNEWTSVPVFDGLVEVISRITTRAFMGLDLCRNTEFRKLCIQSTMELVKGRLLHLFPVALRPLFGKMITNVDGVLTGIEKHLKPIVEYRLEQEKLYGTDWPDKPNDLITWLLESAKASGEERTTRNMAKRVVVFSFASTYSSAVAFAQALYELSSRPEYIQPLREEAEAVVREGGGVWTKAGVGELFKIDSFFRETQRYNGLGLVLMSRRVLKPFTFSDGTHIPAGTHLCVNAWGNHRDDDYFPSAETFDGLRFAKEGGMDQPLMAAPTLEYNAFGHGRPACPGRFFAVAELKMMLGYVLMKYDLKLAEGANPKMAWLESKVIPDKSIQMVFRKRGSA